MAFKDDEIAVIDRLESAMKGWQEGAPLQDQIDDLSKDLKTMYDVVQSLRGSTKGEADTIIQNINNTIVENKHPTKYNYAIANEDIPRGVALGMNSSKKAYKWTAANSIFEYMGISTKSVTSGQEASAMICGELSINNVSLTSGKNIFIDATGSDIVQTASGSNWIHIGVAKSGGNVLLIDPRGKTKVILNKITSTSAAVTRLDVTNVHALTGTTVNMESNLDATGKKVVAQEADLINGPLYFDKNDATASGSVEWVAGTLSLYGKMNNKFATRVQYPFHFNGTQALHGYADSSDDYFHSVFYNSVKPYQDKTVQCGTTTLRWKNTFTDLLTASTVKTGFIHNSGTTVFAGDTVEIAAGKSLDCVTGGGYLKPRRLSQSDQPTPDSGELLIWRDPDDNKTYLVYNDSDEGVRKVEMT